MTPYYDIHIHTDYSDGKDCLKQIIHAIDGMGLRCAAITDHFPFSSGNDWLNKQKAELAKLKLNCPVPVLHGVEVNLIDVNGNISISEAQAEKLDIILAHFGRQAEVTGIEGRLLSADQVVDNILKAMIGLANNPLVDIIAHPFNLKISPTSITLADFSKLRLKEVAQAMADTDTVFEVMNNIWWWFPEESGKVFFANYLNVIKLFAAEGVKFSMGSDAHSIGGVGNLHWSQKMLEAAKIPSHQIFDPIMFARKKGVI